MYWHSPIHTVHLLAAPFLWGAILGCLGRIKRNFAKQLCSTCLNVTWPRKVRLQHVTVTVTCGQIYWLLCSLYLKIKSPVKCDQIMWCVCFWVQFVDLLSHSVELKTIQYIGEVKTFVMWFIKSKAFNNGHCSPGLRRVKICWSPSTAEPRWRPLEVGCQRLTLSIWPFGLSHPGA